MFQRFAPHGLILLVLLGSVAAVAQTVMDGSDGEISAAQLAALKVTVAKLVAKPEATGLRGLRRGQPRGVCGQIERGSEAGARQGWFDDADRELWPSVVADTEPGRVNRELAQVLIEVHCKS